MNVYGLSHPYSHMTQVLGSVFLNAKNDDRNITFKESRSQFKQLYAIADGGFDIQQDVLSRQGELSFTWKTGTFKDLLNK